MRHLRLTPNFPPRRACALAVVIAALGGLAACEPHELARDANAAPTRGERGIDDVPPEQQPGADSVISNEEFKKIQKDMAAKKPAIMKKHLDFLKGRFDLSDRPDPTTKMFRGKPIQRGPRAVLPEGLTFEALAQMSPDEIKKRDLFPRAYLPLPHPNHPEGGMLFPKSHIDKVREQSNRRLDRFDLDFDLPEHFLAESPPAIFLTTRPDLGDVSQGKLVTAENFYELFYDKIPPKQLDGLRLLVSPFAQRQFNLTNERRVDLPQQGVSCFDCHANGHTNGATHLVGDIRPQEHRNRVETPSLRGVAIQQLFGSQRALKTVEDFTEFEQRAAYFDGDQSVAARIGQRFFDRAGEVQNMAEFQEMLDFPPAPKLGWDGKLDVRLASEVELRGQEIFFGKGRCFECHATPHYTDNTMHDLPEEKFFEPRMTNGMVADGEGPIKTFPLRGIKDSPPYLHDGRLLTLDDTVEYFNLILELGLERQEKADLVEFLKVL